MSSKQIEALIFGIALFTQSTQASYAFEAKDIRVAFCENILSSIEEAINNHGELDDQSPSDGQPSGVEFSVKLINYFGYKNSRELAKVGRNLQLPAISLFERSVENLVSDLSDYLESYRAAPKRAGFWTPFKYVDILNQFINTEGLPSRILSIMSSPNPKVGIYELISELSLSLNLITTESPLIITPDTDQAPLAFTAIAVSIVDVIGILNLNEFAQMMIEEPDTPLTTLVISGFLRLGFYALILPDEGEIDFDKKHRLLVSQLQTLIKLHPSDTGNEILKYLDQFANDEHTDGTLLRGMRNSTEELQHFIKVLLASIKFHNEYAAELLQ